MRTGVVSGGRRHGMVIAGVFAIGFALIFLLMDRRLNMYDEGLVLVDAIRMLDGDVIHRDFYSNYGPGSSGILALLFRLDDHWFVIGRLFGVAIMAGIVATSFALLSPRVRPSIAWTFTALCGAWMLGTPFYLYPLFPCVLLALIGSAVLLRWFERGDRRDLLLAGGLAGATALFRYDAGFFLALAQLAAVGISADPAGRRHGGFARVVALYGLGCTVVFAPLAAWYLSMAPMSAFVADIVDYPLHYYAAMRSLPFPGPRAVLAEASLIGVYLPIPAVLLATVAWVRTGRADPRRSFLLVFALLTAVFFYKGVVRAVPLHMLLSILPSLLVLAVLTERALAHPENVRVPASLLLVFAAVPSASAALRCVGESWRDGRTPLQFFLASTAPQQATTRNCPPPPAMRLAWQDGDYLAITQAIRRLSRPDEPIFVGLDRHDRTVFNPIALYFASGRRPGTHWHHFDPGLQTRADIQTAMIADLIRHRVRWVVRDASFATRIEPNASSRSSGVHLLDRFLDQNYRPVVTSGPVSLWLDKRWATPRQKLGSCDPQITPTRDNAQIVPA